MKKVIIIAMLLSLLSVCGLSAGVCFADEASTYYYVNSGEELTVYSAPQITNTHVVMHIPSTYAFKYVKEESNTFVEIEYNGCKGYVLASDLSKSCVQVNGKWGSNPYAYNYNASDFNSFTADKVNTYTYNENVWTAKGSTDVENLTVTQVYGYYKGDDQEIYFLVDLYVDFGILDQTLEKYYIKASDFSTAQANVSNIPQSEGYKAQTATDNNTMGSGNASSNVGDNDDSPKDASNAFERWILIAVIAVLCVVIVILIFAPTRRRQG